MNWTRKFALLAVPAVLALGGGALAVHAAPVHQAMAVPALAVPAAAVQTVADPTEPGESTIETVESGDVGLPGGGHADPAGANVDNQFQATGSGAASDG